MKTTSHLRSLLLVTAIAGTHGFGELCLHIKQGGENSGPNWFPHWFRGFTWRNNAFSFRFEQYTPYRMGSGCQSDWNILYGRSRCGFFTNFYRDSAAFYWRAHPDEDGKIQLAGRSFDDYVNPSTQVGTLEQVFSTAIEPGTKYHTTIEIAPDQTYYELFAEDGTFLEGKTVNQSNLCASFNLGSMAQLKFGDGECPSPNKLTVCYDDAREYLWHNQ